jgi:uncharacterized protein (DUF433 family)
VDLDAVIRIPYLTATRNMSQASTEHIVIDEKGVPRIAGRRTKVIQIVMDKMAYGWTPEEIQSQHPDLTLAEVYAAFAYYHDHKSELDAAIEESIRFADEMRAQSDQSWLVEKLRAKGKLP